MRSARAPLLLAALAIAVAAALAGCGGGDAGGGGGRVVVVATTTQLQDFARQVGGDRIRVVGLLEPGIDPHDYEPTPGDVAAIANAVVVLRNGVGLDDWVTGLVEEAGSHPVVVDASHGVRLRPGAAEHDGTEEAAPKGGGPRDPHIWMDPRNAAVMVGDVADALVGTDPDGAPRYRANARAAAARLRALDRRLAARIATVPAARRRIVTDHDALGYMAARYGMRVVGAVIPSLSTGAEPDARALADLVETIRWQGVRAVFAEESVNPRISRQIADESGARIVDDLYVDTLGPHDSPAGTYVGMMEHDMDRLVAGLSGR